MISQDHLFLNNVDIQKLYEEALEEIKTNSLVKKNSAGTIYRFNHDDEFHHETKPSVINPIKYFSSATWFKEDKFDRDYGPAVVEKDKKIITWYQKGKEHRIGGFSMIDFNKDIYTLNIDGCLFEKPITYLQASKDWVQKNPNNTLSAHDKIEIIEDLEIKYKIGYFDKNLWKNGHFLGKGE